MKAKKPNTGRMYFTMKTRNLRKLVALLIAVLLLCSSGTLASASSLRQNKEPTRWINTSTIVSCLTFNGTTASCTVSVDGFKGTTRISATYELQLKIGSTYSTVKTWTASANAEYLDWNDSYSVAKGYTYRLYVTANVTRNGTTETANGWTEGTCN